MRKHSRAFVHLFTHAMIALALAACDQKPLISPAQLVESLTKHVYVPLAQDALVKSQELAAASNALCDTPSPEALTVAKKAWIALRTPWKQAEVMSFGPHRLFPWRTESRVDFWPAREEEILSVLEGDQDLSAMSAADTLGAASVGMPVVEYLLFGDENTLSALKTQERRCDYLLVATRGIEIELQRFVDAWTGDYQHELLHPEQGDQYKDMHEVFSEVVNNLTFTVELVREKKLGAPLGMDANNPDPTLAESRFSGRSLQEALLVLKGAHDVMTGCYHDRCGLGLRDMLRERRSSLVDTYEELYADARDAIKDIPPPLTDAITTHPKEVELAVDAVRALATFLQVEVTQALNVTVTFGGTDGD